MRLAVGLAPLLAKHHVLRVVSLTCQLRLYLVDFLEVLVLPLQSVHLNFVGRLLQIVQVFVSVEANVSNVQSLSGLLLGQVGHFLVIDQRRLLREQGYILLKLLIGLQCELQVVHEN